MVSYLLAAVLGRFEGVNRRSTVFFRDSCFTMEFGIVLDRVKRNGTMDETPDEIQASRRAKRILFTVMAIFIIFPVAILVWRTINSG